MDNVLHFMTTPLPGDLCSLLERGEFSKAEQLIAEMLRIATGVERLRLEFELDRIARWRYEFPYTLDQGFRELGKEVPDLKREEMEALLTEGCLDYSIIDGEVRLLRRFVPNAFWMCPKLKARRAKGWDELNWAVNAVLKSRANRVTQTARELGGGHVLPLKYRVRAEIVVKPGVAPKGETLRVWLPLPRVCDLHPEVRILSAEPRPVHVACDYHPQRTAYFEVEMGTKGSACSLEFEFVSRGFYIEVDPQQVYVDEKSDIYELYTSERPPHVVKTPCMVDLAQRIVGDEKNPYLVAKRIWDWVTSNVRYTYARDYTLYNCISKYVAKEKRGDCGMQALLFITLCRIAGVPARWQSGWYMNPVKWGMHDWAQFYVEPYGWLYADPSFGGKWRGEGWRNSFYFGNSEGYRMAPNIEVSSCFDPPKKFFRSDPVDSQRGEVEWERGNLYYDKWDFQLRVLEVKSLEELE